MDIQSDLSRVITSGKKSLKGGPLNITTAFECGAGIDIMRLSADHYSLVIPADPPSIPAAKGYNYYFCVRLLNKSSEIRSVTLDALRPGYIGRKTEWYASCVPVFISEDFRAWYVLDDVKASENHEEYRCVVTLQPGQTVHLSNSLPYPHQSIRTCLRQVQTEQSIIAKIVNLGHSVEGREILLLSITDPQIDESSKDRMLVTSGFHPAEPDWLATTAIIETLLLDDGWTQRVRQEFIVDIVVQVNPDGFDHGTNGCNAHGVNLYWDFRPTDRTNSPEAVNLWRWIENHPPCLYIDFHAYVHQLHKDFRPYIRPLSDYPQSARPVVQAIDRRLIALCNGRSVQGRSTNEPTTLAAQITNAFGTITYTKFHLHLKHGVSACQTLGIEVFKTIMETARAYRPLTPKVAPHARRRRNLGDYCLFCAEQSSAALRIRSLWRRVKQGLGMSSLSARNNLSSALLERGLAAHWRQHLWSQREQVAPVIVIGREDGRLQ